MEKKSIGQFIAALRKVNGLTQKQLAEKLNVSDKAISRWERDECLPDLSLIPVLAEIFGVTSDELLRGERINVESDLHKNSQKTTKRQMEFLLNDTVTKFRVHSIISIGIAILGLLAAMICNFGFLRAYIGFFAASIFYLIAVMLEAIFVVRGFSSIRFVEYESEAISQSKKQMMKMLILAGSIIAVLFVFSLPLVIFPWDTYVGLVAGEWFLYGSLFGGLTGCVCFAAWLFVEKKALTRINRSRMFKKMAIVLGITFFLHIIFMEVMSSENFATAIRFDSVEKFAKYMEMYTYMDGGVEEIYIGQDVHNMETTYYDENGNEISEEEALTEYIYADDGKTIVKTFLWHNQAVSSYNVNWNHDEVDIEVYTYEAMRQGWDIYNTCSYTWWFAYMIEIIGIFIWEYRKSMEK